MTPELEQLTARLNRAERRARLQTILGLTAVGLSFFFSLRPAALAQSPGVSLTALLARLAALEAKTAPITTTGNAATGYLVTISKANVQIVNGLGATNGEPDNPGDFTNPVVNGLGNLIVGYNESTGLSRAGSHNLILGAYNSYSSFGGLVAGDNNAVSEQYGVAFGLGNQAAGPFSTVTGGQSNTASGPASSVTGGYNNSASGFASTVSGGRTAGTTAKYGWSAGVSGAPVTTYEGNFVSP